MNQKLLMDKSVSFAARVIKLYQHLSLKKNEPMIATQIFGSATSIGKSINEAIHSLSKEERTAKIQVALKNASETEYWLKLLILSDLIEGDAGKSLLCDCLDIKRLLIAAVKAE